ncbi:hypothetical protein GCM10011360_38210 [Primorskyibacter flagellatus]|uniref:Uncharacterized protein n=1 Tax=Primorskyibacter flagellatus TaxID=1387277 RepID=A0A917EK53_9RHOB|nr:hypothetical protein [Primorskyibacter flagellatus]GGE47313.1 hypothetical protein GCM10011360_38210 [Primorskyibacter flagellatus]
MTRLFAAMILLLVPAICAAAETAVVRSGEHDGFTRLVVYLPETTEWTLREEPDRVTLITGPEVRFDTSTVFPRIGRQRVRDVLPSRGSEGLAIILNCRCGLRTETLVGNVVVLDLLDPPATQLETAAPPPPAEPAPPDRMELPVPVPLRTIPMAEARRVTETATRSLPDKGSPEASADLQAFETEILKQLSLAATQGVLSASLSPQPRSPEADRTADLPGAGRTGPEDGVIVHQNTLIPMETEPRPVDASGIPCITNDRLDLADWRGEGTFAAELGRLRSALTGEFDDPAPATARALARFYIAYGFGAEAEAILSLPATEDQDSEILRSMSRIVDLGHDPDPSPFDSQRGCEGPAGLWSALAGQTGAMPEAEISSLLHELNALPPPLRTHLGTVVAANFVAAGNAEAAEAVFRILDRTDEAGTPRSELAKGQYELEHGDRQTGRALLDQAAGREGDASPEALLALVRDDLSRDMIVPEEVADRLAAYFLQYRDTPLAADLAETEALARASSGQFEAALASLASGKETADRIADVTETRSHVVRTLAQNTSDPDFLKHALRLADHPEEKIAADAADAIAERLLDLGFPELAATILQNNQPLREDSARAQIAARVSLGLGRGRRAEAELHRFQGTDIAELLAKTQAANGDHTAASESYRTLNMPEQAEHQAWLAGDWTRLSGSDDPLRAALATLMTPDGTVPEPDRGPLSSGRRLLQDSTSSRSTIEKMLDRYALPAEPQN